MTEAELTVQVVDTAHKLGYKAVHWRAAMTGRGFRVAVQGDGAGWPDLTLCKPGRMVVAELKRDGHDPTPQQQLWLDLLATVPGVECYVWRPADWRSDAITRTLLGQPAGTRAPAELPGIRRPMETVRKPW